MITHSKLAGSAPVHLSISIRARMRAGVKRAGSWTVARSCFAALWLFASCVMIFTPSLRASESLKLNGFLGLGMT